MSSAERPHSVSVAGVIVDDEGRALLIQRRDNGRWEPPGGVMEPGETVPEALWRKQASGSAMPSTPTGRTRT